MRPRYWPLGRAFAGTCFTALALAGLSFFTLTALIAAQGVTLARALLPAVQECAQAWAGKEFQVRTLGIREARGRAEFVLQAVSTGSVYGKRIVPANVELESATLLGHFFQPAIVALTIAAAWPRTPLRCRALAGLILLPLLAAIAAFDVPLVLIASLHDVLYANLAPGDERTAPLPIAMNLLNGGGRLALGIAAGACAVTLARRRLSEPTDATAGRPTATQKAVGAAKGGVVRSPLRR